MKIREHISHFLPSFSLRPNMNVMIGRLSSTSRFSLMSFQLSLLPHLHRGGRRGEVASVSVVVVVVFVVVVVIVDVAARVVKEGPRRVVVGGHGGDR